MENLPSAVECALYFAAKTIVSERLNYRFDKELHHVRLGSTALIGNAQTVLEVVDIRSNNDYGDYEVYYRTPSCLETEIVRVTLAPEAPPTIKISEYGPDISADGSLAILQDMKAFQSAH